MSQIRGLEHLTPPTTNVRRRMTVTNSKTILWLRIGLLPALLTAALFGGRLLDALPGTVGAAVATAELPVVQQRHRFISDHLYGIDFYDERHGIATGYYGTVLQTTDGGESWHWRTTGETELLRRVHMTSINQAFAIGHRGTIYSTADGGESWQAVHREPETMLRAVALAEDGRTGWAVGNHAAILRTQDGGQTWHRQPLTGFKGRDLPTLNGIALTGSESVALAGEFGTLAFSNDGGATWLIKESPTATTLTDIAVTPSGFLAVGLDGTAVAITPEGDDYDLRALVTGSTEHLLALSVNADGEGVAVGRGTVITVAGESFSSVSASDSVELSYNWFAGVHLTPAGTFWSVGRRGLIVGSNVAGDAIRVMYRLGTGSHRHDATNLTGGGS
jgi:photosystem II stability/assembly factor-like uncharacterized protein